MPKHLVLAVLTLVAALIGLGALLLHNPDAVEDIPSTPQPDYHQTYPDWREFRRTPVVAPSPTPTPTATPTPTIPAPTPTTAPIPVPAETAPVEVVSPPTPVPAPTSPPGVTFIGEWDAFNRGNVEDALALLPPVVYQGATPVGFFLSETGTTPSGWTPYGGHPMTFITNQEPGSPSRVVVMNPGACCRSLVHELMHSYWLRNSAPGDYYSYDFPEMQSFIAATQAEGPVLPGSESPLEDFAVSGARCYQVGGLAVNAPAHAQWFADNLSPCL